MIAAGQEGSEADADQVDHEQVNRRNLTAHFVRRDQLQGRGRRTESETAEEHERAVKDQTPVAPGRSGATIANGVMPAAAMMPTRSVASWRPRAASVGEPAAGDNAGAAEDQDDRARGYSRLRTGGEIESAAEERR